jgi:hypothetical protein
MIVGGAVGLHLVALLLLGDDDVVGVPADVDDSAEVTHVGDVEVALPLLVLLDYAVPAFGALCVPELAVLLLSAVSIFYLDGVCTSKFIVAFTLYQANRRCSRLS